MISKFQSVEKQPCNTCIVHPPSSSILYSEDAKSDRSYMLYIRINIIRS